MKRLLTLMMILLMLVGCKKQTLLIDQQGLHQSVLDYYNLTNPAFKGNNCETKIEIVKVETEDNIYYRYLIVLVPLYFDAVQLKSASIVFHNQEIQNYLNNEVPLDGGYDAMSMLMTDCDVFDFKNVEDFRSILFARYLKIPREILLKNEYSLDQIEDMLANFDLIIKSNNFKDVIKVENLKILVIEDSIDYNREDINEMRKNNPPLMYATTYTLDEVNIDHFIKDIER